MASATADAMRDAAKNENGAMMGFAGLNFAQNAGGAAMAVANENAKSGNRGAAPAQGNGAVPNFCPNCGEKTNGSNFCGNCGTKLN